MLKLNTLSPAEGARKQNKRVGRGPGSGSGKTAARGHKGARSRTGYSMRPGFEGGQMPLHRRLPKRGFTNIFKAPAVVITLSMLERFEAGMTVEPQTLVEAGLIDDVHVPVKVLANGELGKALTLKGIRVSQGAKEKIAAAGGSVLDAIEGEA